MNNIEKDFVELISRKAAKKAIVDHQYSDNFCEEHNIDHSINTGMALIALSELPLMTRREPIIDKIRAEIENGTHHFLDGEPIIEIKEVLKIIDKYKAESEPQESEDKE